MHNKNTCTSAFRASLLCSAYAYLKLSAIVYHLTIPVLGMSAVSQYESGLLFGFVL